MTPLELPSCIETAIRQFCTGKGRLDFAEVPAPRGSRLLVGLELNQAEHARRAQVGLGGVDRPTLLEALASLPTGHEVPLCGLDRAVVSALAAAPIGVAELDLLSVVRRLERPLLVRAIVASGSTFRTGIAALNRVAGLGSRFLQLPPVAVEDPLTRWQADRLGVGLVVESEVVVEPRPFRQVRFGTVEWQFKERVYASLLDDPRPDHE